MLNTTRLFVRKLAFRCAALISAGVDQLARLASAYQARKGVSAFGCFSQNSRSARSAMMCMSESSTLPFWYQSIGSYNPQPWLSSVGLIIAFRRIGLQLWSVPFCKLTTAVCSLLILFLNRVASAVAAMTKNRFSYTSWTRTRGPNSSHVSPSASIS